MADFSIIKNFELAKFHIQLNIKYTVFCGSISEGEHCRFKIQNLVVK